MKMFLAASLVVLFAISQAWADPFGRVDVYRPPGVNLDQGGGLGFGGDRSYATRPEVVVPPPTQMPHPQDLRCTQLTPQQQQATIGCIR
jgi:hypothetical protein